MPAPSPVSGSHPPSTAMRQVDEHLETFLDNRVALLSANARDKTHAAGVVFV
jgi:hypothetical protein